MRFGSTPLLNHRVVQNIWMNFQTKPFTDYVVFLGSNFFSLQPGVCFVLCFTAAPWRYKRRAANRIVSTHFYLLFRAVYSGGNLLLFQVIEIPVVLHRNILINFRHRTFVVEGYLYYRYSKAFVHALNLCIVHFFSWGLVSEFLLLRRIIISFTALRSPRSRFQDNGRNFLGLFCLISASVYLLIITFTGLYDRYLIPIFVFLIIWLAVGKPKDMHDTAEDTKGTGMQPWVPQFSPIP